MPASYDLRDTGNGLLPWSHVVERVVAARNYWLSTASAKGMPHAAPVWGIWMDDAFFFATDAASRKGRNLAANPRLVVHLESGDDVVIIEGIAEVVTDRQTIRRFTDAYAVKYQVRPEVGGAAAVAYRVKPRVAFAWLEKDFVATATRWRFS
jgi:pyridoxine/pyridoxamine 5'-phosphate oxidase